MGDVLERKEIESRIEEWGKNRMELLKKIAEAQQNVRIWNQQQLQFNGAILAAQEMIQVMDGKAPEVPGETLSKVSLDEKKES